MCFEPSEFSSPAPATWSKSATRRGASPRNSNGNMTALRWNRCFGRICRFPPRLGTPLGTTVARPDGAPYRSGTEREFDLMPANRARSSIVPTPLDARTVSYNPQPLDTRSIELPAAIAPLVEQLAEHNHDIWARQRIADGWTWGPRRDDAKKTHPGLVSYAELSETEKQYDRNSAIESLKAIVLLGYEIRANRDS